MDKQRALVLFAWLLSAVVVVLAIFAWGQGVNWPITQIPLYALFPVFGLLAFSLMWTHYIVAAIRDYVGVDKSVVATYFETTSWAVLIAICLHPGILIWQLWKDGLGLPLGSVYTYVGPNLKIAVTFGLMSLLVFLAYEFRRKFSKKSWWKFVQYACDIAMLAIVYHSLKLGGNVQHGWFHFVWIFYAVSLVMSLIYIYTRKLTKGQNS
jgi:hypothetical protein